jgi:predicted phage tail protein
MAKIFSGLTLLVALAAVFFGFQSKDLVEKLRTAADREHTDLLATKDKLKKTEKELADTKDELAATKDELAKTKDTLVKVEADLKTKEAELVAEKAKLTETEKQLADINKNYTELKAKFGDKTPDEITKSIADMEEAKKELETKVAELTTVNGTLVTQKKEAEDKIKDAESKIATQSKKIDRYVNNIVVKGLSGTVLAVNSGWGFCVLSIGDRQGAAANKIMIVARNGQAIGKVKIINVEASQSVADIIPSSFTRGTYIQPGDQVIYTGEDKVREEPAPAVGTTPAVPALPGVLPLPQ